MLRALQRRRGDSLLAVARAAHLPGVAQWLSSLAGEFNQAGDVMRRNISTTTYKGWGLEELIRPRVVDSTSGKEDSGGKQQASKTNSSLGTRYCFVLVSL
jgi:hypothetical protein